jgi:subtilisin family serine protease
VCAINLSLGSNTASATPCAESSYEPVFAAARAAGIVPVVASGNEARKGTIASPACAPSAVSVGAVYDSNIGSRAWGPCNDTTTAADKVACFSNSASFLTLLVSRPHSFRALGCWQTVYLQARVGWGVSR